MNYICILVFVSVLSVGYCDNVTMNMNTIIDAFKAININKVIESIYNIDKDIEQKIIKTYKDGLGNPEINMNFTELVNYHNYTVETHSVVTEDGYILTLFRIPGEGPPVLLQHGMFNCPDELVTSGPNGSLAFLAADDGFDVWLGATRGSRYSLQHQNYSNESWDFWNTGWHEVGVYDLPAIVDYVLNATGYESLSMAGHSAGSTTALVFLSERPEYNKKINVAIMLSTIVYMYHIENILVRAVVPLIYLYPIYVAVGLYYFPPVLQIGAIIKKIFCSFNELTDLICGIAFSLAFGFDPNGINWERMAVQFAHAPTVTPLKELIHYGQLVNVNRFQQFDYGPIANLEEYGTAIPPEYPLEQISTPIAFFHSHGDVLSNIEDVFQVINRVQNVGDFYVVPDETFNHEDYIWSKDAKDLVYQRLKMLFNKFGPYGDDNYY